MLFRDVPEHARRADPARRARGGSTRAARSAGVDADAEVAERSAARRAQARRHPRPDGGSGPDDVVVGIGLNVGWAPGGAARLGDGCRSRSTCSTAMLAAYDRLPADITDAYRDALATLGQSRPCRAAGADGRRARRSTSDATAGSWCSTSAASPTASTPATSSICGDGPDPVRVPERGPPASYPRYVLVAPTPPPRSRRRRLADTAGHDCDRRGRAAAHRHAGRGHGRRSTPSSGSAGVAADLSAVGQRRSRTSCWSAPTAGHGADPTAADAGGIGTEADVSGHRSDTIMILRRDTSTAKRRLLSIPRDLWVHDRRHDGKTADQLGLQRRSRASRPDTAATSSASRSTTTSRSTSPASSRWSMPSAACEICVDVRRRATSTPGSTSREPGVTCSTACRPWPTPAAVTTRSSATTEVARGPGSPTSAGSKRQQQFVNIALQTALERIKVDPVRAPATTDHRDRSRAARRSTSSTRSAAAASLRTAVDRGIAHVLAAGRRQDDRRQRRAAARRRLRRGARLLPWATARRRQRCRPSAAAPPYYATVMKALILAGGAGTRLRPITHTSAKQLVPVANKPILFYGIEAMVAAGITEIGMIVGDTRAEVMAALGDGAPFGATITYIPQDAPLGLAHCVLIADDFLGDDDFVMYLGDNLLEQDLGAFVARVRGGPRRRRAAGGADPAQAGARPAPLRHRRARRRRPRRARSSRSRPTRRPTSRSSASTCSTARSTTPFAAIAPSPRGELEITDAIQWLIDQGKRVRCELLDRLVDRHRQAHAAARGQPAAAREDRTARSTARSTRRRPSTAGSSSRPAPTVDQLDVRAARW